MMTETKALIDCSELGARGFAIEAQVTAVQGTGAVHSPGEQGLRDAAAGELTTDGEAMDIGGLARRLVRPEERVFELELQGASGNAILFGEEEEALCDIGGKAVGQEFAIAPHGLSALRQPLRSLREDGADVRRISG